MVVSLGDVVLEATSREHLEIGGAPSAWNVDRSNAKRLLPLSLSFQPRRNSGVSSAYVLLCQMVEVPDDGRLAAITVALVMVISSGNPELSPFENAALRFIESVIGAGTAVLAVLLWLRAEEAA